MDATSQTFRFAAELGRPELRNALDRVGYSNEPVIVAAPGEPVTDLVRRHPAGRVLLAVPDPGLPSGWTLAWLTVPGGDPDGRAC